jgi:hypothetical protein
MISVLDEAIVTKHEIFGFSKVNSLMLSKSNSEIMQQYLHMWLHFRLIDERIGGRTKFKKLFWNISIFNELLEYTYLFESMAWTIWKEGKH